MKYFTLILSLLTFQFEANAMELDYNLEFGLVLQNDHGEPIGFKQTTSIPINLSGQHSLYGLVISKNSDEEFMVSSVHVLPETVMDNKKIMGKTMLINGKGAVFMKTQQNDVPGNYAMEIYINSVLYRTIKYQLLTSI
jgi:hypothetical protein